MGYRENKVTQNTLNLISKTMNYFEKYFTKCIPFNKKFHTKDRVAFMNIMIGEYEVSSASFDSLSLGRRKNLLPKQITLQKQEK